MTRQVVLGGTLGVLLFAALGYSAWRVVSARDQQVCRACQRHIHGGSKTVSTVAGRTISFCCPSCALSESQQSGNAVRVTALTDFESGRTLDPSRAFLVRGSDINLCTRHETHLGSDKQPLNSHFDRCSPGLLAFAGVGQAQAFAREHGGQIIRFSDLVSAER